MTLSSGRCRVLHQDVERARGSSTLRAAFLKIPAPRPITEGVRPPRRGPMGRKRSDAEQQIAELLQTAKKSLQLSVAFLSRLDGTTQHLEVVESSIPFLFKDGPPSGRRRRSARRSWTASCPRSSPTSRRSRRPWSCRRPRSRDPQLRLDPRRPQRRHPLRHLLRGRADLGQGAGQARQVADGRPRLRGRGHHRAGGAGAGAPHRDRGPARPADGRRRPGRGLQPIVDLATGAASAPRR